MDVPFHRLRVCGNVLVAAQGASIHTFRVADGTPIAVWRAPGEGTEKREAVDGAVTGDLKAAEPTTKKRKLADEDGDDDTNEAELTTTTVPMSTAAGELSKAQKKRHTQPKKKKQQPGDNQGTDTASLSAAAATLALRSADLAVVSILEATEDGKHVVVILGHDKTVRVLSHDLEGHLVQQSSRVMPKRPCAVAVTADGETILVGDKFGDVYGLPLHEEPMPQTDAEDASTDDAAQATTTPAATPLQLEANHFTVHTKGNLQALQNQLRQKAQSHLQQARKEVPATHHHLLLGHVSMLTAVAVGQASAGSTVSRWRPLILTADRDEHIRVTRGITGRGTATSQTHVIETFCLGHTSFVSCLCVVGASVMKTTPASAAADMPPKPNRLISAGGDGTLRVWSYWPEGRQIGCVDLGPIVNSVASIVIDKIAVSGLWAVPGRPSADGGQSHLVLICERVPALFFFTLAADGCTLTHAQTLALPDGRLPLDIATVEEGQRLVVATMSGVNGANTTSALLTMQQRVNDDSEQQAPTWVVASGDEFQASTVDGSGTDSLSAPVDITAMRQLLLYGIDSLRKDSENDTQP